MKIVSENQFSGKTYFYTISNRMKRYLLVRKGKTLLKRCARLLDEDSMTLLCTTLFQVRFEI